MVKQWCPEKCLFLVIFVKKGQNGKIRKFPTKTRSETEKTSILTGSISECLKSGGFRQMVCWGLDCIQKKPGERATGSDAASTDVLGVRGGGGVPGYMGYGGGRSICGAAPWYGSGWSFTLFPHCGTTVGPTGPLLDPTGPCSMPKWALFC